MYMSADLEPAHYDQRWMDRGNCAGLARNNPEVFDRIFFPGKGKPANKRAYRRYCTGCPVQLICLKYAVVNDLDGIWGGTTKSERTSMHGLLTMQFLKEALAQGFKEKYASPEIPRQRRVAVRDEFLELEVLERSDFVIDYDYNKYLQKVNKMIEVFEDEL